MIWEEIRRNRRRKLLARIRPGTARPSQALVNINKSYDKVQKELECNAVVTIANLAELLKDKVNKPKTVTFCADLDRTITNVDTRLKDNIKANIKITYTYN